MAELDSDTEKTNGESYDDSYKIKQMKDEEVTLYGVLSRLISSILFPDPGTSSPLVQRIKASVSSSVPLLRDASKNTGRDILQWTRRGSHLRALLVVSVSMRMLVYLSIWILFRGIYLFYCLVTSFYMIWICFVCLIQGFTSFVMVK